MGGSTNTQSAFRIRSDDGTEATATWLAALDTNAALARNARFRIRFQVTVVGASIGFTPQLQASLNGAAFANVTTSSSIAKAYTSANVADGTATTEQLNGAGTFLAGEVSADGLSPTLMPNNQEMEHEFCVELVGADLRDMDKVQLRVSNAGTGITYAATPEITISRLPRMALMGAG